MKHRQTKIGTLCSTLLLAGFLSMPIQAQTLSGWYQKTDSTEKFSALLYHLRQGDLKSIPKLFFQEAHDDELPDLVMFIDEAGTNDDVKIALLKGEKKRQELFGERYVYVLAFWATNDKSRPCASDSALIRFSALDQREGAGEFALFTAFKYIAAAFSKQAIEVKGDSQGIQDFHQGLRKIKIGSSGGITLYFLYRRLPLHPNTINRVQIQMDQSDSAKVCLATFGNYSPSWITSSVGVLTSFSCFSREPGAVYPIVDPFLFGHFYLKRPQHPKPRLNNSRKEWERQLSISLAVGTQLSGKLFDDLFLGCSFGHLVGKLGLVAGVNFRMVKDGDTQKRLCHLACGLTYLL